MVIDNANKRDDLIRYQRDLNLPNWKVLVTTRATVDELPTKRIETLSPENAQKLFGTYCKVTTAEADLLEQLLKEVAYHTLVIELLAKSLKKLSRKGYTLNDLIQDLSTQGILQLSASGKINTTFQGIGEQKPQAIIRSMFNIDPLPGEEQHILQQLSVLPPSPMPYQLVSYLLKIGDEKEDVFDEHLEDLLMKGWLEYDDEQRLYRMHPLIQEVIRDRMELVYESFVPLIRQIKRGLDHEKLSTQMMFIPLAESVSSYIPTEHEGMAGMWFSLSDTYRTLGNLLQAWVWMEKSHDVYLQQGPSDMLAVIYERLGTMSQAQGKFEQARQYFEQYNQLTEELYEANPHNESLKNGLAISYSKLGEISQAQGKFEQARQYFEQDLKLTEELYEANPLSLENVNGLALSYANLARSYQALGEISRAHELYLQAQKIWIQLKEQTGIPKFEGYLETLAKDLEKIGQQKDASKPKKGWWRRWRGE